MAETFNYKIMEKNSVLIVIFQGKISKDARDALAKCQEELSQVQSKAVVFLFKDVPAVDMVAFRELTLLQTDVRKNGLAVNIVGLSSMLKQYLTEKGIIRPHEVKSSLDDALRAFA